MLWPAAHSVAAKNNSSGIVAALQKKYQVTETTPDREQITRNGTTMSMKVAGVYSLPTSDLVVPDNKVKDGEVQTPSMFVRMTWTKMGSHVLQAGDKVYITKIDNKTESSGSMLRFTLLTVDSLDAAGQDSQKKYDANVSFHFKKGYLDETPPEDVEQAIEAVLAPDTGDDGQGGDGGGGGDQPQGGGPPAAAPPRPAAAATPPPAPPPPPPAAPATINIGESSTEVLKSMGMPLQMIDLGKKKTYVYKNMKIIFLNDKVSDVQ